MNCDEAAPLIDAFAEDALDDALRAPLAAHLDACAACRLAVLASRRLTVALATLPAFSPSAAADARALAAIEEERAWASWRARARRVVLVGGAASAAVALAGAVFVATPAATWFTEHAPQLLRVGESWLRLRAAPALAEAQGTLAAAVAVLVVVAVLDRTLMRWRPAAHSAR